MNSVLTVTQLNKYISYKFKDDINLKGKLIKGEISNFTNHLKTGHFYFTLKDKESSIKAIMFNNFASEVKFKPENGMDVIVIASVQVFERDGVYQLYVTDMQPSGIGALYLAFEQLKEKLSNEGLFDEEHKLPLPSLPKKIGIITAKTGAALQDILNILERRYPIAEVLIIPTLVQGENAPKAICDALMLAQSTHCDVLILGRGGGSLEDLMAFNNELVAKAIYNSAIPIISAVGHETDVTIADFVADLRAPTPSAAAELVAPDKINLHEMLQKYGDLLYNDTLRVIYFKEKQLELIFRRFSALSIDHRLQVSELNLHKDTEKLNSLMSKIVAQKETILNEMLAKLESLNPLKVLSRGYSLVYKNELLVSSTEKIEIGETIKIKLANGEVLATINEILN